MSAKQLTLSLPVTTPAVWQTPAERESEAIRARADAEKAQRAEELRRRIQQREETRGTHGNSTQG